MKFLDRIPAFVKNRYFLVGVSFVLWLSFFDNNNFFFHAELVQEKNELKTEYLRLKKETAKNQIFLRNLNNSEFMEKYARERYLMKKDGEDVFIIEKQE